MEPPEILPPPVASAGYRGRLAPSPTGYLHLGHARTFWFAQARARAANGILILRNDDLDRARWRPEFDRAIIEDLRWFGLAWQEGPDLGGPRAPYVQSQRHSIYQAAFDRLRSSGHLYPCYCSRQDVLRALAAPHVGEDEPVYPGTCRPPGDSTPSPTPGRAASWRFRVPDGRTISFPDSCQGDQAFVAGTDFGDFVIWRHDGLPAYQLATVVDDALLGVTEVVRGADLLPSTARQLLLYEALNWTPPRFHHCPLLTDEDGIRLSKRHESLSLRALRAQGATPEGLRARWDSLISRATTQNQPQILNAGHQS